MYLDWLVNGEPDTAPSARFHRRIPRLSQDPAVQERIAAQLQPFQEPKRSEILLSMQDAMDWDGAIALLAAVDEEKAARINRNNWPLALGAWNRGFRPRRRLSRQLELVETGPLQGARSQRDGGGRRVGGNGRGYDLRAFFLSPSDRKALFHRIAWALRSCPLGLWV